MKHFQSRAILHKPGTSQEQNVFLMKNTSFSFMQEIWTSSGYLLSILVEKIIIPLFNEQIITNLECAKTDTGDNCWIIGQESLSFHLSVLESVYTKTQNPVLCK